MRDARIEPMVGDVWQSPSVGIANITRTVTAVVDGIVHYQLSTMPREPFEESLETWQSIIVPEGAAVLIVRGEEVPAR